MSQDAVEESQDPNYQKELLEKNLEFIYDISIFSNDPGDIDMEPLTEEEVDFFGAVLKPLYRQPKILADSHILLLYYVGADDITLEFLVSTDSISETLTKHWKPIEGATKIISGNIAKEMNDDIEKFDREHIISEHIENKTDKLPFD